MEDLITGLALLQDLSLLKRDRDDRATAEALERMGFHLEDVKAVNRDIGRLTRAIDPTLLTIYQHLSQRYRRPLAAVRHGVCQGCFSTLPTSSRQLLRHKDLVTRCEHCGRLLYSSE